MELEGVIVCKDYSDFLEHTLPENLHHFKRLVVVTHWDDKKTQSLCHKYSIDCVQTDVFHKEGAKFNKGRGINLGLAHLKGDGWFLQLDADTVVPHNLLNMLHKAELDKKNLYGADRFNVYGYEKWMKFKHKCIPHYSSHYFVEPLSDFPLGARIIHREHGYCPIGYFQLWHSSMGKKYPIYTGTAEHSDVLFACQWSRAQRILLPEVIVYHLESEVGPKPMGANWQGRQTSLFEEKV
jgi:hypothetical protein